MRPSARALTMCLLSMTGTPAAEPVSTKTPAIRWQQPIEVATGGGYRGPWRMNESKFLFVDDPIVAVDEAGTMHVAWVDQARQDIFFQVVEADGAPRFDEPVNVSRSPNIFSWLPRLVVASGDEDRIYVLWQEIVFSGGTHGGEIFFARSTDGGKTFGKPLNLSNSIAGDGKGRATESRWYNGSLDIAPGPKGMIYAAWTEYEGRLLFARSGNGGESFSKPLHVAGGDDALPVRGPSLAVAGETIYLAWAVGEDPAADIYFAISADGGRSFSEPTVPLPGDGHSDGPKIAVDGEHTLHLVYGESPAGPLRQYRIRYSRSRDGGETFGSPRTISDPTAGDAVSSAFPHLALDGESGVYVLWERFPEGPFRSRGLGFTWSDDGGGQFSRPAVVPGSADPAMGWNGSQQGLFMDKLDVNDSGLIGVVNSRFQREESSRIRLFRANRTESEAP